MSIAREPERALPRLYASTLFLSAALLFLVQPMFAKLALPLFGGAPAVWNTSAVFFQASLLAGYAYAHALARTLDVRWQMLAHAMVMPLQPLPASGRRDGRARQRARGGRRGPPRPGQRAGPVGSPLDDFSSIVGVFEWGWGN